MGVNASACSSARRQLADLRPGQWDAYLEGESRSPGAAEHLALEPRLQWRTNVGRAVPGGIALTPDFIVSGSSNRFLTVLSRKDGKIVWRKRLGGNIASVPLVEGAMVYAATEHPRGRIYKFDLTRRKAVWESKVGAVGTHLARAEDVLLAVLPNQITAIDLMTGRPRWATRIPGPVRAAPTVVDGFVVVATVTDTLLVFHVSDGSVMAKEPTPGTIVGAPAGRGELLVLGTTRGFVVGVRVTSLEIEWTVDVQDPVVGSVAIARDTAFALTRDGALWLIPIDQPAAARKVDLGVVTVAGPAPIANGVLVATVAGEILWIDASSEEPRWITRVDGPVTDPPIVKDGELVIVGGRGNILVYR